MELMIVIATEIHTEVKSSLARQYSRSTL